MVNPSKAARKFRSVAILFVLLFAGVLLAQRVGPRLSAGTPNSQISSELAKARRLAEQGDFAQAEAIAKAALEHSPNDVPALNLLGIIYNQQGHYDNAVSILKRALALNPHSPDTLNNLGTSYASQGKSDLAEQMFRATLQESASNRTANYNLAMLFLDRGHPKEALPFLRRISPEDTAAQLALVRAYLEAGRPTDGLSTASAISRKWSKDARVRFSLGMVLGSHRQYAAAVRELESANALTPGIPEILLNLGQAYLLTGRAAEAQRVLEQAQNLQPDSSRALYLLAQALSDQQKDIDALELLVRARKLAPKDTNIVFLMARLSMKQSFFEDAIELLNQGLKIDPRRADFYAALGESYFTVGKVEKAMENFKTLITLDPSPTSYAFMGLCYRHLNQYDDAKSYFNKALAGDPRNLPALFNLGLIARKQQDNVEAEKYLRRALAIDPNYPDALFELGSLMMDLKNYTDAIPLLRRCTETSLKPAQAYYKLALAERNAHQVEASRRDMNVFRTLSKNPQPGPYPLQHFFDYLEQRSQQSEQQKDESDIRQLEAEVKQHPDRPRSLFLLASAYLKLNRISDAQQTIARLDELSSGDFRTNQSVGVLLARYHLYPEAIRHLEAALKTSPESDEAKYNLGEAYFRERKYDEALQVLRSVSTTAQRDIGYLTLLGDIHAQLGQNDEAANYFRQAITTSPQSDESYAELALTYLRTGQIERAIAAVREGLNHVPDSAKLYWLKGVIEVARNDLRNSEQSFKRAQKLDPTNELAFMSLGMMYYEQGRIADAKAVLNLCREMFPNGDVDLEKVSQVLDSASGQARSSTATASLSPEAAREFLQLNLAMLAEKGE